MLQLWMELKGIVLSEISQKKGKQEMISLIVVYKKQNKGIDNTNWQQILGTGVQTESTRLGVGE